MKDIIKLFIPEKAEIIMFLAIATIALGLQNIQRFWLMITDNSVGISTTVVAARDGIDTFFADFIKNLDDRINPNLMDYGVWLLVGCIAFVAFSILAAVLRTAGDEVNFMHFYRSPKSKAHEMVVIVTKLMVRASGILATLFWLILFLSSINPGLTNLFFTSMMTLGDTVSVIWLFWTPMMYGASLYAFTIFVRMALLRPKLY